MPILLAMDTSLGECSVALWRDGCVVTEKVETTRNRQTEKLIPMVESVLLKSNTVLKEVTHIITTAGPGSFTGIRIALAAARGFTLATHAPTLAVSTLELLAWQAHETNPSATYAVFINAYRGEVYTQLFTYDGSMKPLTEAFALPPEEARKLTSAYSNISYAGDAAGLVMGAEAPALTLHASAAALARYAAAHILNAADYPPQPLYIRAPDAKVQEAYLLASQGACNS